MKKTYMINTRKADGSMVQKGVCPKTPLLTPSVPAIMLQFKAALTSARYGSGSSQCLVWRDRRIDTTHCMKIYYIVRNAAVVALLMHRRRSWCR